MKKALLPILLCLVALVASGCSAQSAAGDQDTVSTAAPGEKTVIQYYDSTDSTQITDTVVAAFNAQSADTYVELHLIDNEVYDDTIAELLADGKTDIDCLYVRQPCQVNQFASQGLLLDLTDYVAQSDLNPAAYGQTLDIISIADTIPALPRTKSVWLLFYNIDIFNEYGLGEPSNLTWDEYADLAQKLTRINADGSVRYGGYVPPWTLNIGAVAAGEYLYDDELPYTRTYIQLLNRLYNVDHSCPDIAEMEGDYNLPNDVFLQQKVATMINGDWVVYLFKNAYAQESSAFHWGIATLPVFDGVPQNTSVGNCSYLGIATRSQHAENAFEFLSYFCGAAASDMQAALPTCAAYYTDQSAELYEQNADVPGAHYVFDSIVRNEEGSYLRYRELNLAFKQCLLSYLRGDDTLEEAFQTYEKDRLPILQSN